MKCARLHLHERSKPRANAARVAGSESDLPRRFCQKRMVNPAHEEDPRWMDLLDRFYCHPSDNAASTVDIVQSHRGEDLFLSVQNIKFNGDVNVRKRPKTCFKYKAMRDGKQHRMFVKQIVEEKEDYTEECSSQLTCYYFDDYVKYILNPEHNIPSEKSSILLCGHGNNNKEHKAVQAKLKQGPDLNKFLQRNINTQNNGTIKETKAVKEPDDLVSQDTKISYHKSGKRKCLTISRAQSPETVQVIRVDVVCHPRGAGADAAAAAASKQLLHNQTTHSKVLDNVNMNTSHFSNKYLLTNTTKTLDENVSGGAKVTLLCKTFRLSSRTKSNNEKSCIKNNSDK